MLERHSPLHNLTDRLATGTLTPFDVAGASIEHANGNASHNSYIRFNAEDLQCEAEALSDQYADVSSRPPLHGVPISLKDCFDLAGTVTTFGSRFYASHNAPATEDSAMAARLHDAGALITGKTHLHALAYGITGENPGYGDCAQPRDSTLLTGGSSSGAAASVQEGSALAAIGTDTGGSIRVPAALCGLAGYRASHRLANAPGPWAPSQDGLWAGAAHLAPAFDTPGILVRDPRDLAPIAHVLFGVASSVPESLQITSPRIGFAGGSFLTGADADVVSAYDAWREKMERYGASFAEMDTTPWLGSEEVFAGIQAHEAAEIHRGYYDQFDPPIAQRLRWGASLTAADLAPLEQRQEEMRTQIALLFESFDLLLLPCAPVARLRLGADQSAIRPQILRYTSPFSIAGLPVVALPGEIIGAPLGTGVQMAAAAGNDAALLAYAAELAQSVVDEQA